MDKNQTGYLKNYLIKGAVGSFALKVISTVLSLGISILLARLLGVKGYGVYAYAMALIGLMSLPTQAGLPQLVVREVAKYEARCEWHLMRGLLQRANQAVFVISLLLVMIASIVSLLLLEMIDEENLKVFWVALFLLPLMAFSAIHQATLRGLHHILLGQLADTLIRPGLFIILLGVTYLLFQHQVTPFQAMVIQIVVFCVAVSFSIWWVIYHLPKPVKQIQASYNTSIWMRSAVPFLFLSSMQTINLYTDIVILGIFRSTEEVGIYRIVITGSHFVLFSFQVVNTVIAPSIAKLYSTGDMQRLQRTITVGNRAILLLSLPIAIIFIFFGQEILVSLFGSQFGLGATALAILSFGLLICTGMGSVGPILTMTGHEYETAKISAIAAGLNIILNIALIPNWGIEGAAIATATSMIFWHIFLVILIYQRLGLHSTFLGQLKFI